MEDKVIGFYGGKFLPLHLGHIYSILYAASRCDELHVFLFTNSHNEENNIAESKFPKDLLKPDIRELILRYEFENYGNIFTHTIDCKKSFKNVNEFGWDYYSSDVIDNAKVLPNIIFSSEIEQERHLKLIYPFAKFELIDPDRSMFNISSTKIRIVVLGENVIRERLISDLAKIFMTSCVDKIDECKEDEVRKKVFEARYKSNKIFFVNSASTPEDKYISFYKINNYRFSINFNEDDIRKYDSINLNGDYSKVLYQGISRVRSIILNY